MMKEDLPRSGTAETLGKRCNICIPTPESGHPPAVAVADPMRTTRLYQWSEEASFNGPGYKLLLFHSQRRVSDQGFCQIWQQYQICVRCVQFDSAKPGRVKGAIVKPSWLVSHVICVYVHHHVIASFLCLIFFALTWLFSVFCNHKDYRFHATKPCPLLSGTCIILSLRSMMTLSISISRYLSFVKVLRYWFRCAILGDIWCDLWSYFKPHIFRSWNGSVKSWTQQLTNFRRVCVYASRKLVVKSTWWYSERILWYTSWSVWRLRKSPCALAAYYNTSLEVVSWSMIPLTKLFYNSARSGALRRLRDGLRCKKVILEEGCTTVRITLCWNVWTLVLFNSWCSVENSHTGFEKPFIRYHLNLFGGLFAIRTIWVISLVALSFLGPSLLQGKHSQLYLLRVCRALPLRSAKGGGVYILFTSLSDWYWRKILVIWSGFNKY